MRRYLLECSKGLLQKTAYALEASHTIGRDPQNTLCLGGPNVSRRHAKICLEDGQWVLYDLASRNGTYVNGEKIQIQRLMPGDLILIGQTTLKFLRLDEPAQEVSLEKTEEAAVEGAPREIHEQMDLVRTFLDALPIGVAIINDRMEVRYCNQAMTSIAPGHCRHESSSVGSLIACPFLPQWNLSCNSSPQCEVCALHTTAERVFGKGDSAVAEEIPWQIRGGGPFSYVRFSMIPLPYRLVGERLAQLTWEDITSRKDAEETLRKAHDHLERRVRERTSELREAIEKLQREIVVRKQAEENLLYLSTHDGLTGLYNRAFFEEEMARLGRGRQSMISVVIADVDGLKGINDDHGHAVGDALLRRAASVLMKVFRTEDVVARIGGDEFAVLLPDTDVETAREIVGRVKSAVLADHIVHRGPPLHLSLGAATTRWGASLMEAFREADREMYGSKSERVRRANTCWVSKSPGYPARPITLSGRGESAQGNRGIAKAQMDITRTDLSDKGERRTSKIALIGMKGSGEDKGDSCRTGICSSDNGREIFTPSGVRNDTAAGPAGDP